MTVLRVNSREMWRDEGDDGWYLHRSEKGVNISWSKPPLGAGVCIPHEVWDQVVEALKGEEVKQVKRKRRRRAPAKGKITLS